MHTSSDRAAAASRAFFAVAIIRPRLRFDAPPRVVGSWMAINEVDLRSSIGTRTAAAGAAQISRFHILVHHCVFAGEYAAGASYYLR
jgi:hypothetical protein